MPSFEVNYIPTYPCREGTYVCRHALKGMGSHVGGREEIKFYVFNIGS
jgi:hypothetical protein